MRGLPSTGKTHTARRLAGDTGITCETDEFFYTQVGSDPNIYDYDSKRKTEAREWNFCTWKRSSGRDSARSMGLILYDIRVAPEYNDTVFTRDFPCPRWGKG